MTVHSKGWIPHFENLWLDVSHLESTTYQEKGQNMFDYKVKCDESQKKESKCFAVFKKGKNGKEVVMAK